MQESNNDYMNNKYPTNPKLVIPDIKVSTSYIICAAIWFKDGNKYECHAELASTYRGKPMMPLN